VLLMKAKTVVQYENLVCSYPGGVVLCHYHSELEAVCSSETYVPTSKLYALVTENIMYLQQERPPTYVKNNCLIGLLYSLN
jgi:hypothetical protein